MDGSQIHEVFEDGGELLREVAQKNPRHSLVHMAVDNRHTQLRDDSFQAVRLRGDTLEIQAAYADSSQLWQHPDQITAAEANGMNVYTDADDETRLMHSMIDRAVALRYGLSEDEANKAILVRIKLGLDGTLYDADTRLIRTRAATKTYSQFGKLVLQRTHGGVVADAAAAALHYLGERNQHLLQQQDGEKKSDAKGRVSAMSLSAFGGLVSTVVSQMAFVEDMPWIYRSTVNPDNPQDAEAAPYYTTDPRRHKLHDDAYTHFGPGMRNVIALLNQSLTVHQLAGGDPDSVNIAALEAVAQKANQLEANIRENERQNATRLVKKIAIS